MVDETSKKSIQEKLKSSNLFELRQKLLELNGKSPLKPLGLPSPTKSSIVGMSPLKMNLLRSPSKLLTPSRKDQLATPTKSPLKYDSRELLTSPTKMLQSILSSPLVVFVFDTVVLCCVVLCLTLLYCVVLYCV